MAILSPRNVRLRFWQHASFPNPGSHTLERSMGICLQEQTWCSSMWSPSPGKGARLQSSPSCLASGSQLCAGASGCHARNCPTRSCKPSWASECPKSKFSKGLSAPEGGDFEGWTWTLEQVKMDDDEAPPRLGLSLHVRVGRWSELTTTSAPAWGEHATPVGGSSPAVNTTRLSSPTPTHSISQLFPPLNVKFN